MCISMVSAAFAKADVLDKNAQLIQAENSGGLQFKDWGISFTPPAQWQRWTSQKESAVVAQARQSVNTATLKEELIHIAGWSAAEEAGFMVLTVKHERSGGALQLSDLLARHERDDKQAMQYGDATMINRLAIDKIGSLSCVVHDVTLRAGGRMVTYDIVSGSENVQLQWLFRDAARFAELKPAVDGVIQTILIGDAKQYVVALMRPAETGDTYRMQATCRQTQGMKRIIDGQEEEGQNKNIEYSLELEAGVSILDVSKAGDVTKFSLTVTNFTKTQDAAKTTFIPKDSLVMGYVDDAGYGFTINGNPVDSETQQALCTVIQLGKGGRWSDDEVYDSKESQKVGNSWKINSVVAARNLAKTGVNAQVDTITGTATLEQVTEIEGTPCLKVRGEMSIKGMLMPSIPDFKVENAEMHMAYSATFPTDITKGRLQETQEMRMTCSMRGNPPAAGGAIVLVQSTAERTLTMKMTYPK